MSFPKAVDRSEMSDLECEYNSRNLHRVLLIAILAVAIVVFSAYSLTVNGRDIGFLEACSYIVDHIMGVEYVPQTVEWFDDRMLWNIYLPRVCLGIFLGAGLAVCGVAMQSVMNNPLADSYTTGISDGACFGAVLAVVTGFTTSTVSESMGIVTNAFVCGLIPATILIVLSSIVRMSPATSILVGVALSYLFSGLESLIMVGTDADTLKEAYLWQIGSLGDIMSWDQCYVPITITVLGSAILWTCSNKLNLLSLGEDSAKSLGLDVRTFKALVMIVVSVVVAALVSFVGIVGFVGLVAPHMVRMIIGGNNRYLIPCSAMFGSMLILIADLISRTVIAPDELRIGVIVSMIGAPIFLYIIVNRKKSYGEVFRCPTGSAHWRMHTAVTISEKS